jgi:hypothetical protein
MISENGEVLIKAKIDIKTRRSVSKQSLFEISLRFTRIEIK